MKLKTFITHDGTFHADEVFAYVYLKLKGIVGKFIRTRGPLVETAKKSKEYIVSDVGMEYNPEMFNFDHHQDGKLHCAFSLVVKHFPPDLKGEYALFYFQNFVDSIDAVDVNRNDFFSKWRELTTCYPGMTNASSLISSFCDKGTDEEFQQACSFAEAILKNMLREAEKYQGEHDEYKEISNVLYPHIVHLKKHNRLWKEDFLWSVSPTDKGNWGIIASRSKDFPVPDFMEQEKGCIFLHKNRFIAVFDSEENALNAAFKLHLWDRGVRDFTYVKAEGQTACFMCYGPFGNLKGCIYYVPSEEPRYAYKNQTVFGWHTFDPTVKTIYLVEGVFDAVKIKRKNVFAVCTNNPEYLREQTHLWKMAGYKVVVIPDNDKAGEKLVKYGNAVWRLGLEKDLGEMSEWESEDFIKMFESTQNEKD